MKPVSFRAAEEHMLRILSECGELSASEYAAECAITVQGAYSRFKRLYDLGTVHVAAYKPAEGDKGKRMAVFAIGRHDDAPKPEPYTESEMRKAYEARLYADPKRKKKFLAKRRKWHKEARLKDTKAAETMRKNQREWRRRKYGYGARPLEQTLKKHYAADPLLAALLGVRK